MFLQASCNERLHDGRFIAPPPQGRMLNTPLQSIRRGQDQCFDTCFLVGTGQRTPDSTASNERLHERKLPAGCTASGPPSPSECPSPEPPSTPGPISGQCTHAELPSASESGLARGTASAGMGWAAPAILWRAAQHAQHAAVWRTPIWEHGRQGWRLWPWALLAVTALYLEGC